MSALDSVLPFANQAWLWAKTNPWQGVAAVVGALVGIRYFAWLLSLFRIRG